MGNTRDTGYLRNLVAYDGSGNITLPANLTVTGSLLANGGGSYATQSYVTTQISNLVNAAPGALDTLNELATALGNDANFSTTVTNSIATKLALSGGTLTGALTGTTGLFNTYVQGGYLIGSGSVGLVLLTSADWGASSSVKASSTIDGGNFGAYLSFNNPASKGFTWTVNNISVATLSSAGSAAFKSLSLSGAATYTVSNDSIFDFLNLYNSSVTNAGGRITFGNGYGYIGAISVSQRDNGSLADDGKLQLQVASNAVLDTKVTILNTGFLGIGTADPSEPLSISFASHGLISQHRQSSGVGVGQNFYMKFNNAAGTAVNYAGIYADIQSNTTGSHSGKMILQVANGGNLLSALTILPNGNIGIGTTGPNTYVEVNRLFGNGSTQTDYLKLTSSQGGAWFSQMGLQFAWNDFGNGVSWSLATVMGVVDGWTNPNGGGALTFHTKTFGAYSNNPTEKMRITNAGNVGIGNGGLSALGKTLSVEGTIISQTGDGGGNYNENIRCMRAGNGYSSIIMGAAYGTTTGTTTGQWTLVATPSNLNYKFYLDYAGTELFTVTTEGQIQQKGVGIVQIIPITPVKTNISYTATINAQYTIGSTSIPSTARWVLADIYLTANISDHQNFMLTRFNFGVQKTWVDTRGNNPDNEFGNITQGDAAFLTYFGESDGFTSNYGLWKTSVLVPTVGRNVWINNYGNSNSNGYIYFIVRGYSL